MLGQRDRELLSAYCLPEKLPDCVVSFYNELDEIHSKMSGGAPLPKTMLPLIVAFGRRFEMLERMAGKVVVEPPQPEKVIKNPQSSPETKAKKSAKMREYWRVKRAEKAAVTVEESVV